MLQGNNITNKMNIEAEIKADKELEGQRERLPPGRPDPAESPDVCEVCNEVVNKRSECKCEPCKVCGSQGDPYCYIHHGMKRIDDARQD